MPSRRLLYYYPGNASLAPHLVLSEIGAPFELVLVDRERGAQRSEEYLRLNPLGQIPTLVEDGRAITEAAAICLHLADRHPEAGLAPPPGDGDRARFYQWLVHLTNTVQPALMAFHYPERHTADAAGAPAVRAAAVAKLTELFRLLDEALVPGPFLLGPRPAACDLYLLMLARWARTFERPPRELPRLGRCLDLLAERPAVRRTFLAEGLEPPLY